MYLLGYDIGSSSIKAALVNAATGATVAVVQHPETEMAMTALQPGWAEQDPVSWWECVCAATKKLLAKTMVQVADIQGIGISYQMHGLVVVDKNQQALRPSIIWCDSRAVEIGNRAFDEIGPEKCLLHLLNSPGNFTAAKLKWVKDNEPALFEKIDKFMLPGDYIAMRLTGEAMTTASGLSEGILWDFVKNDVADLTLDYFGFDKKLIPAIAPTFSLQGKVTEEAAAATGLHKGIPVAYRAGDQPNNALSLNVLQPGEVAATGGTSGVVYGVLDKPAFDPKSRVNGFLHVNHGLHAQDPKPETQNSARIGILLCINGAGSQYAWVKKNIAGGQHSYQQMEQLASQIPIGSDGLRILNFGNGAERMLENKDPGAHILGLHFNRHSQAHLYRAALEGIAFSFVYGMGILKEMGLDVSIMRVGNDNLFQSAVFANTISSLVGCTIEVVETTGAVGAAKAAGVATGVYGSIEEAMGKRSILKNYEPGGRGEVYQNAFGNWVQDLQEVLDRERKM
ncbi:MAG: carbohydrate kinase [Saprospiraceae bacterium]|nr:carbohydrate kinase [Saprospiraceae bacterium]